MSKSSTAKDLTAGTAGGILQVLVGQPFDIVKVRNDSGMFGNGRDAFLTKIHNSII